MAMTANADQTRLTSITQSGFETGSMDEFIMAAEILVGMFQ
jgi:hypothetical protein